MPPFTMNSRVRLRDGTPTRGKTACLRHWARDCCVEGRAERNVLGLGGAERSGDILSVLHQPEAAGNLHL
jgi:hypothetical protein